MLRAMKRPPFRSLEEMLCSARFRSVAGPSGEHATARSQGLQMAPLVYACDSPKRIPGKTASKLFRDTKSIRREAPQARLVPARKLGHYRSARRQKSRAFS